MEDIFNSVKAGVARPQTKGEKILSLFDIKSPLTTEEVLSGMVNKFGERNDSSNLVSVRGLISQAVLKGQLTRLERGLYCKP